MTEAARYAQLILPVFWLGMVAAISFLEAPIKFRAPGVSLAIGLGIGRKVFTALNAVELVLALILLASCAVAKPAVPALTFVVLAVSVLVVQVAAIRPRLSERSDRILAGEVLPRSRTHVVYIAFELVKVVLLISAIISLFQVLTACLH
ncbi:MULTISPECIES: hypothetical protein [Rhodococcus]|jgi:hypothetical protein|uniref:hypothetical protein n=1 Tax=Rhodococcus TaxID=1827 RepID=UPI0002B7BFAB|nr:MULTISPECIES: hypothetical protein [Rhodococcus]MCW0193088.1 hypothetical protein [Rhodococcus sp. (in: high G+C Gram-positive bacteria)]EME18254.1 hypothetical protein G418_20184 [Rhodococcus qingshengii BKS 20-40]MBW0292699.1 hypothetical protein [Rhodococcus sp. MH15]MEA1798821.1 hypothetical protein [Rhodococcus qingshengii]OQM77725.1 hypothetical protein B0E55_06365 [Rhodococcus sp. 66b]